MVLARWHVDWSDQCQPAGAEQWVRITNHLIFGRHFSKEFLSTLLEEKFFFPLENEQETHHNSFGDLN
jgi:hypothetical protein